MDVEDEEWKDVDYIHLAGGKDVRWALMSAVMNFLVLQERKVPSWLSDYQFRKKGSACCTYFVYRYGLRHVQLHCLQQISDWTTGRLDCGRELVKILQSCSLRDANQFRVPETDPCSSMWRSMQMKQKTLRACRFCLAGGGVVSMPCQNMCPSWMASILLILYYCLPCLSFKTPPSTASSSCGYVLLKLKNSGHCDQAWRVYKRSSNR